MRKRMKKYAAATAILVAMSDTQGGESIPTGYRGGSETRTATPEQTGMAVKGLYIACRLHYNWGHCRMQQRAWACEKRRR